MNIKRKILSFLLILCFVLITIPCIAVEVNATGQNALVKHAKTHLGDKYNNFYDRHLFKT